MKLLKGVHTALITPFTDNGLVDDDGLRHLINRQLDAKIDGVVVLGSTGEDPTITKEEKKRIVILAREEIDDECILTVGTGSYSTSQTIENTLQAESLGADMALIVTPYYNKPTQEGIYCHFKAIAEATSLPIMLYNIQGRTGQNLQTETLKRLMEIPSIIGIKEASGNVSQMSDVIEATRHLRPEFVVLSGDDGLTLPLMALGGHGVVSVLSNLFPKEIMALCDAASKENFDLARNIHYQMAQLLRAIFIETNPIPIKAAMNFCGLPAGKCRLPLCELSHDNAAKLKHVLTQYWELNDTDLPLALKT